MTDNDKPRLEIDWLKTAAGALAAVSSAVALSTLGAAGTIIGAAIGSVIITIGSSVYQQGLARGKERVAAAQLLATRKIGVAQAEINRAGRNSGDTLVAEAHLDHADESLSEARSELDDVASEPAPTWGERLGVLPWKRIALAAAGLFLVAMLTITAFELLSGKSVSSFTGGSNGGDRTSVGRFANGGRDSSSDNQDKQPTKNDDPAVTPSDDATPTDPTPSEGTPSEEPSEEPSDEPTVDPSDEPTVDPTPAAPPTTQPSPTAPAE